MAFLSSWIFWLIVALVLGVAAVGVLAVRAIIRPILARSLKDYGTPQEHGLPAQTVSLPNGIYGWWAPTDKTDASIAVLLIHGRSRSSGWMYPIATHIWPRASVMAIDLPGHGKSPWSFVTYGKKDARTISDAITWLSAHQQRPIVVIGESMGGSAAILAQEYAPSPHVCGLVTIGAYTAIASVFQNVSDKMGLPWPMARYVFAFAGLIAGFHLKRNRPIDAVTRINVPFLAVQGDEDDLVPVESARLFSQTANCPHIGFAYYAGAHDEPTNPQLHAIIDEFLDARERELRIDLR